MAVRIKLLVALGLAVGSTACQPPAQEMATLSEEAVAAIRSISPNFLESASNCDVEAMTAFHAEGAVRIEPGIGPALQGRDAILASFENAPCTNMDFTVEPVRVEGRGDLAYAWS